MIKTDISAIFYENPQDGYRLINSIVFKSVERHERNVQLRIITGEDILKTNCAVVELVNCAPLQEPEYEYIIQVDNAEIKVKGYNLRTEGNHYDEAIGIAIPVLESELDRIISEYNMRIPTKGEAFNGYVYNIECCRTGINYVDLKYLAPRADRLDDWWDSTLLRPFILDEARVTLRAYSTHVDAAFVSNVVVEGLGVSRIELVSDGIAWGTCQRATTHLSHEYISRLWKDTYYNCKEYNVTIVPAIVPKSGFTSNKYWGGV